MQNFENLGITEDTQVQATVPFPIDKYFKEFKAGTRPHPFAECYLNNVTIELTTAKDAIVADNVTPADPDNITFEEAAEDGKRVNLVFIFKDATNTFQHTETIRGLAGTDPKFKNKHKMLNERIAHYFNAFAPGKVSELLNMNALQTEDNQFTQATTTSDFYKGYFTAIANVFNKGNEGTPFYKNGDVFIPVRIKLVRQGSKAGKYANYLQMPLGNSIEVISENSPSILTPTGTFESIQTTISSEIPGVTPGVNKTAPASGWPDDM